MKRWNRLTVQMKYLQLLKCRPAVTEGGQAGLVEGEVCSLGPKITSWNRRRCCAQTANPSSHKAASEQFVPSHTQPRNSAELQESLPVSFSGRRHVIARIHRVSTQIAYNAHCALRDCVYILFWIIDNASLKVLSGISCWNASSYAIQEHSNPVCRHSGYAVSLFVPELFWIAVKITHLQIKSELNWSQLW